MNEQDKILQTRDLSDAVTQSAAELSSGEKTQKADLSKTQSEVENLVNNDLGVIRSLMGMGVVTREQGHNLMKQVIQNAYTNVTTKQHEVQPSSPAIESVSKKDAFLEFTTSNPNFFNRSGREDVLSYLKNSNVDFDKDELLQISKLIEAVEQNAVDRYLKQIEYGKALNDENAIAKQRLSANAQVSSAAENNGAFTRAQIGKMSGDEFTRNEAAIMEQLRKGLIR